MGRLRYLSPLYLLYPRRLELIVKGLVIGWGNFFVPTFLGVSGCGLFISFSCSVYIFSHPGTLDLSFIMFGSTRSHFFYFLAFHLCVICMSQLIIHLTFSTLSHLTFRISPCTCAVLLNKHKCPRLIDLDHIIDCRITANKTLPFSEMLPRHNHLRTHKSH
jgi:hypothetical protein